jgi:hypothetical protein
MTIVRILDNLEIGTKLLISALIVTADVARCGDDLIISNVTIPNDEVFRPFGLDTIKAAVKKRLQQTLTLDEFKEPLPESYESAF